MTTTEIARAVATANADWFGHMATILESADPATMTPAEIQTAFVQCATMFRQMQAGCESSIEVIDGIDNQTG